MLEYEHFNYIVNLHCLQPSNTSVQYLANFKFVVYVSTKIKEQNLIQESSYFRGKNPTCIELIWKTKAAFLNSRTFVMGISDFYALTTSILKLTYVKGNPKIKFYKYYKIFDKYLVQVDLENGTRNLTF